MTLPYDRIRMDKHQILLGTRKLRQDEHKIKTRNATSDNNSSNQSSPTFSIADQLKKVSLQKKRKCNSPETHYGSSIKIVRNEQKDVNFQREKTGKRTGDTESQHFNAENKTQKCSLLTRLLKKDKDGDTILHLSIVQNDVGTSKHIIEVMSGTTSALDVVNKLQQTPLHLSVLTCQPVLVEFLIFHGASVNTRDRNGQTALHLASKNADIECVKAIKHATESPRYSSHIVGEKADLNLKNFEGKAVIHLAVLSGSVEVVKTLLDMKANINIQDGTCGRTALHLTVESHNINMITFLLKNGADVNATTFSGNTPLHLASGLRMDQIVQLLIRNGADINITNIEGDKPLYTKIVTGVHQTAPTRKPQMRPIQRTTVPVSMSSSRNTNKNENIFSFPKLTAYNKLNL